MTGEFLEGRNGFGGPLGVTLENAEREQRARLAGTFTQQAAQRRFDVAHVIRRTKISPATHEKTRLGETSFVRGRCELQGLDRFGPR